MLQMAREVAAGGARGRFGARHAGARARARLLGLLARLLPDRALAHDPVANGLPLGRFLHEDRRELPDIDLDFPRDIREVLIPRVHERYGRDRAALVAAFPTFRARGAIRELGKVLGLPAGELERVARAPTPMASAGRAARRADVRRAGRAGVAPPAPRCAGAGSSDWSPRPTGCRVTSPSIPAG